MHITSQAKVRAFAALGAAALLAVSAGSAGADPGGIAHIPLNVGQEVTGSDTGAHGSFSYTVDGDELCYTLSATNLSAAATAAHIHLAPRRVAGDVVVPLEVGTGTSWTVDTCTTADEAILEVISAQPRNYYVNVHTPTFPGGEIRGQLK